MHHVLHVHNVHEVHEVFLLWKETEPPVEEKRATSPVEKKSSMLLLLRRGDDFSCGGEVAHASPVEERWDVVLLFACWRRSSWRGSWRSAVEEAEDLRAEEEQGSEPAAVDALMEWIDQIS